MIVTLTPEELTDVTVVAREVMARYRARRVAAMRYRVPELRRFVAGFGAERAVAKFLGETWGRGDARRADVGDDIEVRWTSDRPPRLRLYDPDGERSQDRGKLGRRFVLVTGWPPRFDIRGYATGRKIRELGRAEVSPEGTTSYFLGLGDLLPLTGGEHVHGYLRDELGEWVCIGCSVPYVGAVPVDDRHPDGWQGRV